MIYSNIGLKAAMPSFYGVVGSRKGLGSCPGVVCSYMFQAGMGNSGSLGWPPGRSLPMYVSMTAWAGASRGKFSSNVWNKF